MPLALMSAAATPSTYRNPYQLDADIIEFNRDLLAPYGMRVREDLARAGRNVTFAELAEQAMRATGGPAPEPELLILAYALPDLHPLKTVSSHLNHLLGDRCRSFAVSEQGLGAPFTALRIADAYARSGRCHSLALFVLEQTTFLYPEPLCDAGGLTDSGVFLLFGRNGSWHVRAVRSARPPDNLTAVLHETVPDPADRATLLVAGPWTDPAQARAGGWQYHQVPRGSYGTSVWLELASNRTEWAGQFQTVLLCDTDPRNGASYVAVLDQRPANTGRPDA